MKILITGNLGYVGPAVIKQLRQSYPEAILIGWDAGYFEHTLKKNAEGKAETVDVQHYGDIRDLNIEFLQSVDAVVHLCALSNDPIGNKFEELTLDINYRSSVELARLAKEEGVKSFVFASSCSVYGFAEDGTARDEQSPVNPLTAYAKSKVLTEQFLQEIASPDFITTSLRFATACGMSDNLRLDLVLNDFVASAIVNGKIDILSDGQPWRPLIHNRDMARAIDWAVQRESRQGGNGLIVNVGSDVWNYQVKELAYAVKEVIEGTEISINAHAQPDKRSYRVDFGLFSSLAPDYQPLFSLHECILDLKHGIEANGDTDPDFRSSDRMRLKVLDSLLERGTLNSELRWQLRA